ncbi:MAG: hypothetical protein PHZ19_05760, partial [Candidatus Thermoplasmatota archaeon]|nr:hypothetical protein [Candidatus Thermoplasmatota archaeon]
VRRAPEWGYEAKILDAEVVIEIFPPGLLNPIHGRLDYLVEISGKCGRQVLAIEYKSLFGYGSENVIGKSRWTGTPDELALYEELEAKGMEEPLSEREQKIMESLEKYREWSPGSPMDRPSYLTQIWAYMRSGIQADYWLLVCQDRGSKVDQTYEVREVNDCLYWAYVPKGLPGQYGERPRNGGWKKAPFTWEQVVGRLAMIEDAVAKREPPDRICPVMGERYMAVVKGNKIAPKPKMRDQKPGEVWWKCSGYCEYAKLCWLGLGEGNE